MNWRGWYYTGTHAEIELLELRPWKCWSKYAFWQTQICWRRADAHYKAIGSSCGPNGQNRQPWLVQLGVIDHKF